jgi:GNAT superfamily N-acetyltransferase
VDDRVLEWRRDPYLVSTDRARIDVDAVHAFLLTTHWAAGIPRETLERAIAGSVTFGVFDDGAQVGFARAVTDLATYAYLTDVFVMPTHRGRGLGDWLVACVLAHPQLQGLRRMALFTRDAAWLYTRHGFAPMPATATYLEILDRDVYGRGASLG